MELEARSQRSVNFRYVHQDDIANISGKSALRTAHFVFEFIASLTESRFEMKLRFSVLGPALSTSIGLGSEKSSFPTVRITLELSSTFSNADINPLIFRARVPSIYNRF